jgi:hypothetical protein
MVGVCRAIELNQLTVVWAENLTHYDKDPMLCVRYCAGHQTFHLKECFTRNMVVSAPAARVCIKWFESGRPFPQGVCQLTMAAKMAFAYNQNLEVKGLEPLTSHVDLNFLPQKSVPHAIKTLIARIYSDEVEPIDDEGGGAGSSGAGPAITSGGLRTDHVGFIPHHGTLSEKQVLSR